MEGTVSGPERSGAEQSTRTRQKQNREDDKHQRCKYKLPILVSTPFVPVSFPCLRFAAAAAGFPTRRPVASLPAARRVAWPPHGGVGGAGLSRTDRACAVRGVQVR
jgi:hypothetical protein